VAYTETDVALEIHDFLDDDDLSVVVLPAAAGTTTRQVQVRTRHGDTFLVAIVRTGWALGEEPALEDGVSCR
jgi:hypothetical protein